LSLALFIIIIIIIIRGLFTARISQIATTGSCSAIMIGVWSEEEEEEEEEA
jgi:hypothetical protein